MVAHLDYAHDSPERVTSIRVISTTSLQKLLAQLNMDCLLDKEYNNGSRTHRDKSFFDLWWRSSWGAKRGMVREIKFLPEFGRQLIAVDPETGHRILNSFRGWMVQHDPGFRHDPDIVAPLARHLCHGWCSSDALSYTRTLQMFKHMLAKPERKIAVSFAMLLQGHAGSLKSLVFELLGNGLVGRAAYLYLQGASRLEQQFNGFWKDKVLAIIDEINAVDHKGELIQKVMDIIKSLVSGGDYLREDKHYDAVLDRLLARVFMLTNHELPLLLELDDRRIFALALDPSYADAHPWDHERLITLLTEQRDVMALHTLHWLVNEVELDDIETAKAPPRTPWKAAIQRASQAPVMRWLQDVASGQHVVAGAAVGTNVTYAEFYKDYAAFHTRMRLTRADPPEGRPRFEAIVFKIASVDVNAMHVNLSAGGRAEIERNMKLNRRWWFPWQRELPGPGRWVAPAPPPPPPPPPSHPGPPPPVVGSWSVYHGGLPPPAPPPAPDAGSGGAHPPGSGLPGVPPPGPPMPCGGGPWPPGGSLPPAGTGPTGPPFLGPAPHVVPPPVPPPPRAFGAGCGGAHLPGGGLLGVLPPGPPMPSGTAPTGPPFLGPAPHGLPPVPPPLGLAPQSLPPPGPLGVLAPAQDMQAASLLQHASTAAAASVTSADSVEEIIVAEFQGHPKRGRTTLRGWVGDWSSSDPSKLDAWLAWYRGPRTSRGGASGPVVGCTVAATVCAADNPCSACARKYAQYKYGQKQH